MRENFKCFFYFSGGKFLALLPNIDWHPSSKAANSEGVIPLHPGSDKKLKAAFDASVENFL